MLDSDEKERLITDTEAFRREMEVLTMKYRIHAMAITWMLIGSDEHEGAAAFGSFGCFGCTGAALAHAVINLSPKLRRGFEETWEKYKNGQVDLDRFKPKEPGPVQ